MLARHDDGEGDSGPRSVAPGAERTCVATRTVRPVADMIRFVVDPDGTVVPDLKRKLPGRGVWVTARRAVLQEAVKRKAFARGFKAQVKVPPDLADRTEALLAKAVLDALAIAHKAGQVVTGFTKVEVALGAGPIAALLHAADGSADGVRKLAAAVRRRFGEAAADLPVVSAFTSAQLDLALGRSNVIHAALLVGPASEGFLARHLRLERFRTSDPGDRGVAACHDG